MVEEDLGMDIALRIARALVLFLRRPAGQNQFSTSLAFQSSSRLPIRELPVFILENLAEPLKVEVLAGRAAMSVRNFSRIFREEFGVTPAIFVERLRLETALRLVHESNRSLEEIAEACGLGSVDAMRRAFVKNFGSTLTEMR
jgi:transcriptional regulator GlxA family with amidase domain